MLRTEPSRRKLRVGIKECRGHVVEEKYGKEKIRENKTIFTFSSHDYLSSPQL
jgi:hypothetical protein